MSLTADSTDSSSSNSYSYRTARHLGVTGTLHTPCHVSWWELLSQSDRGNSERAKLTQTKPRVYNLNYNVPFGETFLLTLNGKIYPP